ncbi:dihydropteroate synthase [Verrucomicrobiaceae bacterium N1E253]|uniref:Dihydropteroate synthase n=1 Tax=Oceaniferula marina TaxID=2748318 RepID=A0A851GFM2_9BACT|nr:dihydropteroate synthase [Oceaniferula marina]NWK56323.1 dihydropteroate synthase [Oceaniferula marina]
MLWKTRRLTLDLAQSPVVMGILNATPDSFSDGGAHGSTELAVRHACQMESQGAGIIDIGGESTRPGAPAVSAEEERQRVVPVVERLRQVSDVLISVDTSKAEVADAALRAGADIVNDVTGLTGPFSGEPMVEVCRRHAAGVVVMHMQGSPRTMQQNPSYENGVLSVMSAYFDERMQTLTALGLDPASLCFDPGIGFGKTLEHNLELMRNLGGLQARVGRPLLLGVSRKSMIGMITGVEDPGKRDLGTAVLTAMAGQQGIRLHRVHDVEGNRQALALAEAVMPRSE